MALPAPSERPCPGPICQGAPRRIVDFRHWRSKACRLCETQGRLMRRVQRGRPRWTVPSLCGACGKPETRLGEDGKPRTLIAYVDAVRGPLGYLCSGCERTVADADHSIRKLAQIICFLAGTTAPLVVDVD